MKIETHHAPDQQHVAQIVQRAMNQFVRSVDRFATGSCHFVFDVVTESAQSFVVRIARPENRELLAGALYWYELLKPKGVPLPRLLHADLEAATSPFPYIIIERLTGQDLGIVYLRLSKGEKKR